MVYVNVITCPCHDVNSGLVKPLLKGMDKQLHHIVFHGYVKNNAWVTINNDIGVTSEAICQSFSRVTKSRLKIIGKSHHEWPQNHYSTVTNVLFYFLHAIWCPEHTISLKQLSTTDFCIVAKNSLFWLSIVMSSQLICDVTRMLYTGIVTSYSLTVLACANWRKGHLHKWKTAVNIDFSPPGIYGLVCKKITYPCSAPNDDLANLC